MESELVIFCCAMNNWIKIYLYTIRLNLSKEKCVKRFMDA